MQITENRTYSHDGQSKQKFIVTGEKKYEKAKEKPTVQEQIAAMTTQGLQTLEQRMLGLMVGSMSRAQRQAELAKRKNKKKRKANCVAKEVRIGRRINAASQAFKEYEAVRYLALKELEAR